VRNRVFAKAVVVFAVVILIVILVFVALALRDSIEPPLVENETVVSGEQEFDQSEPFVIDQSGYLAEEAGKITVTQDFLDSVLSDVLFLVEQEQWEEARLVLDEFFEAHSAIGEYGSVLKDYQMDLGIINLLPQTDSQLYSRALSNLKMPEIVLSAAVYLSPPVKLSMFIDGESLVPTPEKSTLRFGEFSTVKNHSILTRLNDMFPGEYQSLIQAPFSLEGIDYIAYIAVTSDGFAKIYRIETGDPDAYYMPVSKWYTLLS